VIYLSGDCDGVYRVGPTSVKGQMRNCLDDFIFGYAIGARPFKVSAQLLRPSQSDSNRPAQCGSVLIYLP
jgi:hypothetical protein